MLKMKMTGTKYLFFTFFLLKKFRLFLFVTIDHFTSFDILNFYLSRAPLHEAISQKHLNVCPILVAAGADLHITNNFGKTPKDLGIDCGLTLEQIEQCLGMLIISFL